MEMEIARISQGIKTFIKEVQFRKQMFGVKEADIRSCLEDVSLMYEDVLASCEEEREKAQKERMQMQEQIRILTEQTTQLTRKLEEKETQRVALAQERNSAVAALAKEEEACLDLHKKMETLEIQRKAYSEKTEALVSLLSEQKKLIATTQGAAYKEAEDIVTRAKREAEAIVLAAQEKVRRHTEKEEQVMQSITEKSKELQELLRSLRNQVGSLAKEIDDLQSRAGELKMLRALREQVEELAQELDSLQQRSETATDRGGYEVPKSKLSLIENIGVQEEKEDVFAEASIGTKSETDFAEENPLSEMAKRVRMEEIERQRANLQALLEKQALDDSRIQQIRTQKEEASQNARAAALSKQLAQATELLHKYLYANG